MCSGRSLGDSVVDSIITTGNFFSRRRYVRDVQAGAGVVADSKPEKEYAETVNKAKALMRAVD